MKVMGNGDRRTISKLDKKYLVNVGSKVSF